MATEKELESIMNEKDYELLLAEESFILDAQIAIQRVLNERGFSQAKLARILEVSESYISQMLSDSARNLTLRTFARVMYALNETANITTQRMAAEIKFDEDFAHEAEFGPWGEIVSLDDATARELKHDWLAEEWAANENDCEQNVWAIAA